ncbi:MAG: nucleotidyltransferase domain-containing protein [Nitrospirae bacterium]|nr:nucleotidyltransferase domain-containing protein [Nitrospirota bacterium]MCL5977006.1 nucleotidyltransferase domain-containing protein [Nitrospirota bacterium]
MKKLTDIDGLTIEERKAISEFAELLKEKFGNIIKDIIFFGSKARGEGSKYSDIDILIVLTKTSWEIKRDISELAAQENIKHKVIISTVRYDSATWDTPAVKASPFAKAVREEGVWL